MEKSALSSVSSKILTVLNVIGVGREAQGGGTVLAFEAAPMEKLALGAQPLHHVDPLLAKIARVAASQVLRKLLLYGALWEGVRRWTHQGNVSQAHFQEGHDPLYK